MQALQKIFFFSFSSYCFETYSSSIQLSIVVLGNEFITMAMEVKSFKFPSLRCTGVA